MSPTELVKEELLEDGTIIQTYKSGDFVVCNLSSIHLGRAIPANVLERLIKIQVRMLDNVIDVNDLPVKASQHTNKRYRNVGLGTFSLHHIMALNGIRWGSEEGIKFNDVEYERIAYLAIKASMELAEEKGAYPLFKGSDWDNGDFFVKRDYGTEKYSDEGRYITNEQWRELASLVHENGIRNGQLLAVAPNGSTSILANGTASIDPVFNQFYYEEKKDYKIPVVVPDLSPRTAFFYENAYTVDQHSSIKQNAARQRHIDQSQSFNLYVDNKIKASELLSLVMEAWEQGMKTIYYTRSTSINVLECESCT